jgi:hypothetical protein
MKRNYIYILFYFILLFLIVTTYKKMSNFKILEQYENDSTDVQNSNCMHDCKCVSYDGVNKFCGRTDEILGKVACNNCSDSINANCNKCQNIQQNKNNYLHSQYSANTLTNEDIILQNKNVSDQLQINTENENNKLYNLSLKQIGNNISDVFIDVINDLFDYSLQPNKDYNTLMFILTKEDRPIYVGIIFIIIGLLLYFIDVSS